MAKKYKNDKGFLIIKMNHIEAANNCNFGIRVSRFITKLICDNCGNEIKQFDDVYYVTVLNKVLCKKCLDNFIKRVDRYKGDIPFEEKYYNYYIKQLNIEEE